MSIERKRFDPYRLFNLDKFFNEFLSSPLSITRESFPYPRVDIKEHEKYYEVIAEVPGLDKEDVNVEIHKDILIIRSEKETKTEKKDEKGNYIYKERNYQSFQRQFRLPENSNPEKIKAKMDKGLLRIEIEKKEPEPRKNIKIE
ncbi:MAG: Hsp20/alpha crystallin family protein [Candidatus Helarchaeota archaeon]